MIGSVQYLVVRYIVSILNKYIIKTKFKNSYRVMMDTKRNMFYMDRIKLKSSSEEGFQNMLSVKAGE